MNKANINVLLNAKTMQLPQQSCLADALQLWQSKRLIGEKFACAKNGEFVPRSYYAETLLSEGDLIDIVQPVGGG